MNSLVNIAAISYNSDGITYRERSQPCAIQLVRSCDIVKGEIVCPSPALKWRIVIHEKESCRVVYEIRSCESKLFKFVTDKDKEYFLTFKGDKGCLLRLYNVPANVTEICKR